MSERTVTFPMPGVNLLMVVVGGEHLVGDVERRALHLYARAVQGGEAGEGGGVLRGLGEEDADAVDAAGVAEELAELLEHLFAGVLRRCCRRS